MALLDFSSSGGKSRSSWRPERIAGVAFVLFLHVILIVILLQSLRTPVSFAPLQRELIFVLRPLARHRPQVVEKKAPPSPSRAPNVPLSIPPSLAPNAVAPPMPNGLSLSLFGCAPENLANLTPEERAHCSAAPTMAALSGAIPGTTPERARDAARWASSAAREHAPLAIPCVGTANTGPGGAGKNAPAVMLDPVCLYRQWKNDFEPPEGR